MKGEITMKKVDLNKKKKQDALLNTAYQLFTEKGFQKTSISDIVNEAGVAKGTFYLYFKDKLDIRYKYLNTPIRNFKNNPLIILKTN